MAAARVAGHAHGRAPCAPAPGVAPARGRRRSRTPRSRNPWHRYQATVAFVGDVTYGDERSRQAAIERVDGVHRTVRGVTDTGAALLGPRPRAARLRARDARRQRVAGGGGLRTRAVGGRARPVRRGDGTRRRVARRRRSASDAAAASRRAARRPETRPEPRRARPRVAPDVAAAPSGFRPAYGVLFAERGRPAPAGAPSTSRCSRWRPARPACAPRPPPCSPAPTPPPAGARRATPSPASPADHANHRPTGVECAVVCAAK